jgi:hypothetical protein
VKALAPEHIAILPSPEFRKAVRLASKTLVGLEGQRSIEIGPLTVSQQGVILNIVLGLNQSAAIAFAAKDVEAVKSALDGALDVSLRLWADAETVPGGLAQLKARALALKEAARDADKAFVDAMKAHTMPPPGPVPAPQTVEVA